jgi:hypothetical protein
MYEDGEGDIADCRDALSPVCSECGNPLEDVIELEHGCCMVCWEWITR